MTSQVKKLSRYSTSQLITNKLMFSIYRFCGFTAVVVLYSLRYCRAQGNNSSRSSNPCGASGKYCGDYGVCSPGSSPVCSCLPEFYVNNTREWNSGDWSSGCSRREHLYCDERDQFWPFRVVKMPEYSDRWNGTESECQARCLANCSCVGYGFRDEDGCMFWRDTLIDFEKDLTGAGSNLYIRVANFEQLDQKKNSKRIIIVLVFVGFVIISICAYFFWRWIAKRRGKKKTIAFAEAGACSSVDISLQAALSQVNVQGLPLFKFEILANATNNFSEDNKLGKGGFGPVYKGELGNGREIAVKRLSEASGQGMQEFMNEVVLISKLQHRNLVRLLGCCLENKERMLMYEYMPNKSVDFYLFDSSQEILDWRRRLNIIQGICRGLLYLHRDSRLKIIHRDLKPSNILLDNDWNPKISDFGLARIFGTHQDHVSTLRVVGTYGYMAPEYAIRGRFSEKSDVFSFGVLVLEIATGRRNTSFHPQDGSLNLLGHIWKLWNEGNVAALIDPRISSLSNREEVVRCIHIGLLCVQELPIDRPSIPAVLSMLSSEMIELPEPKQPAFTIRPSSSDTGSSSSQHSQQRIPSINNVTITMVDGR